MLVGAGVEKKMSTILKRFMQHALAGLNRSRVAGFDPLGDTTALEDASRVPTGQYTSGFAIVGGLHVIFLKSAWIATGLIRP